MSECDELHKKLKTEIMADLHDMKSDVKEILKIMNGNGGIGICAKVNFLWGSFVFLIATVATQAVILTKILIQ
jgi:hypothetical protein